MCYKAIFSDIDGTFLNSQHQMLPGTMKIVREAAAREVPFVLVSARMPAAMGKNAFCSWRQSMKRSYLMLRGLRKREQGD